MQQGFVEGDGTFCISDLRPEFSIKQHSKNVHFLHEIAEFLGPIIYLIIHLLDLKMMY